MNHSVYVITSSAQSGKSIVSLGLMQMLKRTTPNVAFFKPLIENKNVVDNHIDTILSHFNVNMNYEDAYSYSRSEFTEHQNQGKINEVYDTIIEKYKNLENEFDFVLVEGSDFTEEGSVFEIDFNGSIAKNLGIPVLLVVKDSFETVPELVNNVIAEVNSFLEKDVNIIGVIVNRCEKEQSEVQKLINKEIKKGIFVAVIPNNPELGKPSIREIINHIRGHVLFGKEKLDNIAKTTVIGAMQLANFLPRITPDSLCIMPGDRSDLIVGTSLANISPKYPNISGIVLTGGFTPERSIIKLMLDNQKPIPIITTSLGTFEAASVISRIKPKIYAENKSKIKLSIDLFESSVDVEELNTKINSVKTESITPRMFQYNLLSNAKKIQKHIVLPEGNDDRILTAASQIAEDKVAKITILGDPEKVKSRVSQLGLNWDESRISIVDPHNSEFYEDYANTLYELRKSKGLELTSAQDLMLDASYFGTMMVHKGHADGMVSGAVNTTAHTIKPALQFVKTKPGFKTVSSVFFMLLDDRVLVYGDCAIVPNPNPEQLAEIDSVYFARLYEAIGGRIYKKSAQSLKRLSSNGSWDVFQQPNIIIVPDSSFPLGIDITTGEVSIEATYSGLNNVNSLGFIMHEIDVIDHFRRTLKIFNEYRDSKYRCVSQVYAKLMDILVLENGDLGSAKLKLYEYMYKKGHKVAVRD